jgi:hypothetical protein
MTNITEQSIYTPNIYRLETFDPVIGGAVTFVGDLPVSGQANAHAQQLANRTKYLNDNKQALDAKLTAMSALVASTDKLQYYTGPTSLALAPFSAAGRALVGAVDANAQLTTLGAVGNNQKGIANGVASLDGSAKVPVAQLTGYGLWGQVAGSLLNQTDLITYLNVLGKAAVSTGISDTTDTFEFQALNDTTLRILAVTQAIFKTLIGTASIVKSFPQQDVALSTLGLTTDGIFFRFIGYDVNGAIQVSPQNFDQSDSIIGLGNVILKRVAGVTTFLDGAAGPRNIVSRPNLATNNHLARTYAKVASNVIIEPNASLTIKSSGGYLIGESVNWHKTGENDTSPIVASATQSFIQGSPATLTATTPPAFTTAVDTTKYWNGSALVSLATTTNASIQRILLTVAGFYVIQVGEAQYANLQAAKDAMSYVSFLPLLPINGSVELARFAATKNCTDLTDNTLCFFQILSRSWL